MKSLGFQRAAAFTAVLALCAALLPAGTQVQAPEGKKNKTAGAVPAEAAVEKKKEKIRLMYDGVLVPEGAGTVIPEGVFITHGDSAAPDMLITYIPCEIAGITVGLRAAQYGGYRTPIDVNSPYLTETYDIGPQTEPGGPDPGNVVKGAHISAKGPYLTDFQLITPYETADVEWQYAHEDLVSKDGIAVLEKTLGQPTGITSYTYGDDLMQVERDDSGTGDGGVECTDENACFENRKYAYDSNGRIKTDRSLFLRVGGRDTDWGNSYTWTYSYTPEGFLDTSTRVTKAKAGGQEVMTMKYYYDSNGIVRKAVRAEQTAGSTSEPQYTTWTYQYSTADAAKLGTCAEP